MAASAKSSVPNTWEGVIAAARSAGAAYPELVAAQWALESGWGKHTSGKHNYFGLKGEGTKTQTTEYVKGKPVQVEAAFLDFGGLGECIQYLVDRWYRDWKGYRGVNQASTLELAAKELVKQGYATDPAYAGKLIRLVADQKGKGAKAPSSPAPKTGATASVGKPVLFTLTATQDTWLKKEPKQAGELAEKEKVEVSKGKAYAVCAYAESPADAHAQVELGHGGGTWWIHEPHWRKGQSSGEAMPSSVDWSDFDCLVTPNLTVGEILQWDRRRIPGPDSAARTRLLRTASEFQKVREAWGQPLGVTSFYRPEPINSEVGGVRGSKHVTGEAIDVYPTNRSLESFYQWIRVRWRGGLGDGRHRGFIHLDMRNGGGFVPGAGARPAAEWTY